MFVVRKRVNKKKTEFVRGQGACGQPPEIRRSKEPVLENIQNDESSHTTKGASARTDNDFKQNRDSEFSVSGIMSVYGVQNYVCLRRPELCLSTAGGVARPLQTEVRKPCHAARDGCRRAALRAACALTCVWTCLFCVCINTEISRRGARLLGLLPRHIQRRCCSVCSRQVIAVGIRIGYHQ